MGLVVKRGYFCDYVTNSAQIIADVWIRIGSLVCRSDCEKELSAPPPNGKYQVGDGLNGCTLYREI